ncbi:MAG: hypothetical protein SGI87_13610 [Flavobacteriales bacterium]|nr:hypothetical protein [Flavobacteriales bacterium]
MLQRITQKKHPMRNAAWTIYCAELVLSRITRWRYRNIGRTITLVHCVDSRIPQRFNIKTLPMRNAGLFDRVY